MRVHFFGATETVTGSKYLVETAAHKILVDCGIFQGPKELRARNREEPPFDPLQLTAIVLTHAHIDHIGYLPLVVRRGYRGPIYATEATCALIPLLLIDSAELLEEEALFAEKEHSSRHHPPEPLYTVSDARQTLELLKPFPRPAKDKKQVTLPELPGVKLETSTAGHILGAVSLSLEADNRKVTFSGDIGRFNSPLLPDPQPIGIGDLLVCESTYGDRDHPQTDPKELLAASLQRGLERRGPIIIPAFAVGRTQTLLSMIKELEAESRIPPTPVYVDSPMAVDTTDIYRRFQFDFDAKAQAILARKGNPLATLRTTFVRSASESKQLNSLRGSRIIISASGMATGGRVLHHLMHWLPSENATVLFAGYQGEGTRGASIQRGEKTVKIFGRYVPIRAAVDSLSGLSAHGDRGELLRWLNSCEGTPSEVRITHGEIVPGQVFCKLLGERKNWKASPAKYREVVEL